MSKQHAPGFLKVVNDALAHVEEVSVEQVQAALTGESDWVVIDVREDREWVAGHVTGALHLGKGVIERDIEAAFPDKSVPLVLYCGGGYRSALAAESLQKMGYTNVKSMAGGMREWCAKQLSVSMEA